MTRRTWLNDLIERFQHRWETNPQYRAAMSGVLGLVFLLVICSCVGALTATTGSVLGALGLGGSNNGQAQAHSGGRDVKGVATFPIATVNLPSPSTIPNDPTLTTSGTPLPTATTASTPTDTPTATPCTSNCGGGGGGGGCTNCIVTGNPLGVWHSNHADQLHIHTSQPGIGISVIINNVPGIGTIVQFQPAGTTDSNGDLTITYNAPGNLGSGTASATITAAFSSLQYATVYITCAP
jgi:hypothetical protein